ncbi:MAG: phosphotransferase [Candidatus Bathyarchaeota archaeon]|nr:phosphotransferase [Candidatus Bathyarchaeota archaeon]
MGKQGLSAKLEAYLDSQYPKKTDHSIVDLSEINMGWETELFVLRIQSKEKGDKLEEDRVLRVFSGGSAGGKASKEFYLMKKLLKVGYPVPEVHQLESTGDVIGKPFIIMNRIIGTTLDAKYQNESPEILKEGLTRLVGLFAQLHQLDVSEFKEILHLSHTDSIQRYLDYFKSTRDNFTPWISPVLDWLEENKPDEMPAPLSVLHMDYHGMNVMLNENDEPFVIDWGASTLGDFRLDLSWTILLYTTFGGSMFRVPIIDIYRELSGKELEHFEFYEVIAATRRISDLVHTAYGDVGSTGLKPEILDLMKESKTHFGKVHDFLEARTGIRFAEFDKLLNTF